MLFIRVFTSPILGNSFSKMKRRRKANSFDRTLKHKRWKEIENKMKKEKGKSLALNDSLIRLRYTIVWMHFGTTKKRKKKKRVNLMKENRKSYKNVCLSVKDQFKYACMFNAMDLLMFISIFIIFFCISLFFMRRAQTMCRKLKRNNVWSINVCTFVVFVLRFLYRFTAHKSSLS